MYIDSTQVNANADLDSLTPRFAVEAREAMQAHLAALFAEEDAGHKQQEVSGDGADTSQTDASTPIDIGPTPLPLPVVFSQAQQEELIARMQDGTTGPRRKVGNNGRCMASTSGQRILK